MAITEEELAIWKSENKKIHFRTAFDFLNCHNSWRPGKLHVFLGVSHGGKSTLVRTLVADALHGNKNKVGIVLSEESEIDFLVEMSESKFKQTKRLIIFEEMGRKFKSVDDYFNQLRLFIIENEIDILFIDNITTSYFYMDRSVSEQSYGSLKLKLIASELSIPFIPIAHTGANITENYSGLIEMNDIRGSKTIVNLAEFFYVLQSFFVGTKRYNLIKISKHRGQEVKSRDFQLFYFSSARMFGGDEKISFEKIKDIFKSRNKL